MKKNILLAVTGSIACSKAELFIKQYGSLYNFKVISTYNALQFLSDEFKKNNQVLSDWGDLKGTPHIELARWADIFLIYPATANVIAKMANGIADDLLTSTTLMFGSGIYICPAMHEEMYLNNTTQNNLKKLSQDNYIVGSRYGDLDIGDRGYGRLIEPIDLKNNIEKTLGKVIVTSGPTIEAIDDVKVITNKSSGKQGRAIAIELSARGYETIYIHSSQILPIPGIQNVAFTSSSELLTKINENIDNCEYLFMTAAVSDFRTDKFEQKIKKNNKDLNLKLYQNMDILSFISNHNNLRPKLVVGFAAETNNVIEYAKKKLEQKHCDWIIANDVSDKNIGFNSKNNEISIIRKNQEIEKISKREKSELATLLVQKILKEFPINENKSLN